MSRGDGGGTSGLAPARPVAMIMLMMDTWLKRILRMYSSPVGRAVRVEGGDGSEGRDAPLVPCGPLRR